MPWPGYNGVTGLSASLFEPTDPAVPGVFFYEADMRLSTREYARNSVMRLHGMENKSTEAFFDYIWQREGKLHGIHSNQEVITS